jgi:dCTP deaminase
MAFIGTKNLTSLLESSDVISPFDKGRIKNGAYELSLGSQVFQTDSKPRVVKNLIKDEKIYIEPGQFALLLTEEYVKIPENRIAFISIKAGVKFKGLVNVSGFHVDPGFEGKLLFSVYNAGPSSIVLSQGTQYFPIWFAELNESQNYEGSHEKQIKIPDAPVESLSQGELASPNALSKRIDDNQKEADKRIGLIEKDHKANNYLLTTAVGLGIVILVKFALDWTIFNTGINKGTELKQSEISTTCKINQLLIEKKTLLIEIDSLQKVKTEAVKQNSQARTKPIK